MRLDFLQEKLDEREEKGNLRELPKNPGLVDFVSNDYLGLAGNQELSARIMDHMTRSKTPNGGTGSRLLSGNHLYYSQLEEDLTSLFRAEATLVFNSGYAANQALVSAVAGKGDTILYDQLAHVCLKEGAWLSRADTISFQHNDLTDLRKRLERAKGRVFVLTETIFSMDGDVAPLQAITEICEEFDAYLIVDEAHSTGVFGSGGSGMLVAENLHSRVFARVYTFGKGMGVHGACVAGAQTLVDYLVNFGRPFIYTTSLPPHSILSIHESFKFLGENSQLQDQLNDRISLFKRLWPEALSDTAIQPVMIGSNEGARAVAQELQHRGYDVRPVLSPTVKKGTERLRISLHVHNSEQEIEGLVGALRSLL